MKDNSSIWIVSENKTLEIRKVRPVWRDADVVLLQDGLTAGEQLIVSELPAPVEGMAVRVEPIKSEIKSDQSVKEQSAKGRDS